MKQKKVQSYFKINLRSRHPSHAPLRKELPILPFRTIVRLGSITELDDGKARIELNSTQSIRNSSNKFLMKQKFTECAVKTAIWYKPEIIHGDLLLVPNGNNEAPEENYRFIDSVEYPIVAKHNYGSKGKGNTLIRTKEELNEWLKGRDLSNYIFEKFYNYAHEFRLHISKDGCFYTCRKALKSDILEEHKWHFHDETCVWYLEDNEKFFKPNSWDDIVSDCVKALEAIGADILAFDVKVQSPTNRDGEDRDYQNYILLECNSAPSMGDITLEKYLKKIPEILKQKYEDLLFK